jgi:hypothetical protein
MPAKVREPGRKKPRLEIKQSDSLTRSTGRWATLMQRVDRGNDRYDKTVVDQETGEVLRDCHEPLSEHTGRGSARPPHEP